VEVYMLKKIKAVSTAKNMTWKPETFMIPIVIHQLYDQNLKCVRVTLVLLSHLTTSCVQWIPKQVKTRSTFLWQQIQETKTRAIDDKSLLLNH
jgi:hypothetical protein